MRYSYLSKETAALLNVDKHAEYAATTNLPTKIIPAKIA